MSTIKRVKLQRHRLIIIAISKIYSDKYKRERIKEKKTIRIRNFKVGARMDIKRKFKTIVFLSRNTKTRVRRRRREKKSLFFLHI